MSKNSDLIEKQSSFTLHENKKMLPTIGPLVRDSRTETQDKPKKQPTAKNNCYFKTRSDRQKLYELSLTETHLIFTRPNSSKQTQINYKLRSFQCILRKSHVANEAAIDSSQGNS